MKFIREVEDVIGMSYRLVYAFRNNRPKAAISFECDSEGKPFKLAPRGEEDLINCVNGIYDVTFDGIDAIKCSWSIHAIGVCEDCGEEIHLISELINTCKCGADYDGLGDRFKWILPQKSYSSESIMGVRKAG